MLFLAKPTKRLDDLPDVLDADDVGELLGLARRTVYHKVRVGELPKPFVRGRWLKTTIIAWMASRGKSR